MAGKTITSSPSFCRRAFSAIAAVGSAIYPANSAAAKIIRPLGLELFSMTISDLVPNLQPMVEQISQQLRFVCFFLLTGSIIVRTSTGSKSISQLMRPLVTTIFLCGIIATLPFWFNLVRDEFWNIAVTIRKEFTGSVTNTGAALMNLLQAPENGNNWLDVQQSLEKAIQYAFGWLLVWFAGVIQLPMMLIQYVMECLCYLFLPIALCLFAFESTKGLAIHYVQQTLAVLAWPIGFAVVDLVGFSLLTTTTNAITGGNSPQGNGIIFSPSTYFFGGVVAIWLILGSLVTPLIMQALFCSGAPLSSAMSHSIQMGLAVAGLSKFLGSPVGAATPTPKTPSDESGNSGSAPSPAPNSPRPPPNQPLAGLAASPGEPASLSPSPLPGGALGLIQSPRGSLAVGKIADSISPTQAQSMADRSGTPFTQAFSNGAVVTHQPAISKAAPASTFVSPLTPTPLAK
jgi:TrbL/VirB6 plasmid conjugal transfer protein